MQTTRLPSILLTALAFLYCSAGPTYAQEERDLVEEARLAKVEAREALDRARVALADAEAAVDAAQIARDEAKAALDAAEPGPEKQQLRVEYQAAQTALQDARDARNAARDARNAAKEAHEQAVAAYRELARPETNVGTIETQSGEIAQLTADLNTCTDSLTTAQTDLSTAQTDLSTAQTDLGSCQADLSTRDGELQAEQEAHAETQTTLTDAQDTIATHEDTIATHEDTIATHEDTIAAYDVGIPAEVAADMEDGCVLYSTGDTACLPVERFQETCSSQSGDKVTLVQYDTIENPTQQRDNKRIEIERRHALYSHAVESLEVGPGVSIYPVSGDELVALEYTREYDEAGASFYWLLYFRLETGSGDRRLMALRHYRNIDGVIGNGYSSEPGIDEIDEASDEEFTAEVTRQMELLRGYRDGNDFVDGYLKRLFNQILAIVNYGPDGSDGRHLNPCAN